MTWIRRYRQVAIDHGTCRCMGAVPARLEAFGYGRRFESSGVFFCFREAFSDQKAVRGDTQACMMMKATPVAPLVLSQAQFLLEFLIVTLIDRLTAT